MEYKISKKTILKLSETSLSAELILKDEFPLLFLKTGYYYINGTLKVLYWDADKEEWMEAVKDVLKMYTFVRPLDKQPKNIKNVSPYKSMYN